MALGINKSGTQVSVNQYTTETQAVQAVTAFNGDNYMVVWRSQGQDGSLNGIYGQHFRADGVSVGNEFRINTTTANDQKMADAAALQFGGFVVTWASDFQDSSLTGVFAQMYNQWADPVGVEFLVNSYVTDNQWEPQVTGLASGDFVVIWNSVGQDFSGAGVFGQMFDFWGSPLGGEFRVNTASSGNQFPGDVTALSDGGFIVAYTSDVADADGSGVVVQRYDHTGTKLGREMTVNVSILGDQLSPTVTELANGNILIAYVDESNDGDGFGIYGRIMTPDNQFTNSVAFPLNYTWADDQVLPQIAAMPDGGFVAVWTSNNQDGNGFGIYLRRFDAQGWATGPEELVNTTTTGDQLEPCIAVLDSGAFMVSWSDGNGDPGSYGVRSQFYAANWVGTDSNDIIDNGGESIGATEVFARGGNDIVNGNELAETIWGGEGNDDLYGNSGDDLVFGEDGADEIFGDAGHDSLYGGSGNDQISGGAGNDLLSGGDGDDEMSGDEGRDQLNGEDGNDILSGGAGGDILLGGTGNDQIDGGSGADTIIGGGGNDEIVGGTGADAIDAGGGNDTVFGDGGADTIDGGTGFDELWGDAGADILKGEAGWDRLFGGAGSDQLLGGSGNDFLDGGTGADTLNGGTGNDELTGGGGSDTLEGGAGSDLFRFYNNDKMDFILDYAVGTDRLAFDSALWSGVKTAAGVIADHAVVDGGMVVFDFGADKLILEGVGTLVGLEADILIF